MTEPIPKWVMQRYSKLWNKYKDKEIPYSKIEETLKGDGRNTISVFLNELRKAGWVEIKLDNDDTRKRKYLLKQPELVVVEIGK